MQERKRRWLWLVIGNTYKRLSLFVCFFLLFLSLSLSNAFPPSPLHLSLSLFTSYSFSSAHRHLRLSDYIFDSSATQDWLEKWRKKRPHTHFPSELYLCVYVCVFTGFIKQDRTFQHHQYGHHHNDASETGTRTHRRACVCVCVWAQCAQLRLKYSVSLGDETTADMIHQMERKTYNNNREKKRERDDKIRKEWTNERLKTMNERKNAWTARKSKKTNKQKQRERKK